MAVIERIWRYTWRPWSCKHGGHDWVSLKMQWGVHDCANMEAVIKRVHTYTSSLWLSQIGQVLGGQKLMLRRVPRLYSSVTKLATEGMWQDDINFDLAWRASWWRSVVKRVMPEAEATFRGQLIIIRPKGRQSILGGFCTRSMLCSEYGWTGCMLVLGVCLFSVYAVLGVNSWSWHWEIERDDLTLYSAMMIEFWTRKREMGMMMRTMWRIQVDVRNLGYNFSDWVRKTLDWCYSTPD